MLFIFLLLNKFRQFFNSKKYGLIYSYSTCVSKMPQNSIELKIKKQKKQRINNTINLQKSERARKSQREKEKKTKIIKRKEKKK